MTTAQPRPCSSAALAEYLSSVDELLARPFPEADSHGPTGCGGPGHQVRILRASQEFWDDDDGEAARAADAELHACLDALAAVLTARWGAPLVVDLEPYLRAGSAGEAVGEPIDFLSRQAGSMTAWPHPDRGRWLGLTVGQGDKELALELLAAVGRIQAFDPSASPDAASAPAIGAPESAEGGPDFARRE